MHYADGLWRRILSAIIPSSPDTITMQVDGVLLQAAILRLLLSCSVPHCMFHVPCFTMPMPPSDIPRQTTAALFRGHVPTPAHNTLLKSGSIGAAQRSRSLGADRTIDWPVIIFRFGPSTKLSWFKRGAMSARLCNQDKKQHSD